VMFTAPPYYGPCVAATSAPETAADLLHDMLPPPTLAWRLTWGPRFGPARRYQRVRAARGGCRVRWFIVTRAADGVSVAAWD
jgi:hypothetical protein